MPSGVMSSPESPVRLHSPLAYVHPRLTERGSYVQRWKALRDRNRNLPKLDFNTQIAANLQRQNTKAHLGITRSLTLESMKLPSISNGSIANGSIYTTKSNKETGSKKVGVQVLIHYTRWRYSPVGKSETESILSDTKLLNGTLSKSLPNVADVDNEVNKPSNNSSKHRYERIAQKKTLLNRKPDKVENEDKEGQPLEQSGIYQFDITGEFPTSGDVTQRFSKNTIGTILENETLSGHNSRQTRCRLENDRIGRRSRRKKWRDNCKCMRCEIMHRQYEERDDHYTKWGIYPCQQHLARQKYFKQYFYDSD
ncbi:unnamed protein product [Mytilus coruscus]|uniref:Uncharacterized protein n=1 Tax=Mytilus coruscus TaxID=42192 RepID=A0A6J8CNG1_MYTCO|nr:unnamed protein product [Mytilus coruscus]